MDNDDTSRKLLIQGLADTQTGKIIMGPWTLDKEPILWKIIAIILGIGVMATSTATIIASKDYRDWDHFRHGECEKITDGDLRNFCLHSCYDIKDHNFQSLCFTRIRDEAKLRD